MKLNEYVTIEKIFVLMEFPHIKWKPYIVTERLITAENQRQTYNVKSGERKGTYCLQRKKN